MNIRLKQRLLAAIVILALIVIFVPMLFRKHSGRQITSLSVFPQAPTQPNVNKITPTAPVVPTQAQQQAATPAPQSQAIQSNVLTQQPATTQPISPAPQSSITQSSAVTQPPSASVQPKSLTPVNQPVIQQQQKTSSAGQQIKSTNSSAQPTTVNPIQPVSSRKAKTINLAQQQVLRRSRYRKIKSNKVIAVKPSNVPVSSSIQNLALSQAELNNIATHVQIRSADVSSNNVMPEISANQKAQQKVAQSFNQAWVLQLGSFVNKHNAANLVKKLRQKGVTAYAYEARSNHIINYRVYVGPMVEKSQAKAMQNKVAKEVKIKGFVTKFDATRLS